MGLVRCGVSGSEIASFEGCTDGAGAAHIVEFDAILSVIGIIGHMVDASTGAVTLTSGYWDFVNHTANQNTAEFIAEILSCRGLMVWCPTCERAMLRRGL